MRHMGRLQVRVQGRLVAPLVHDDEGIAVDEGVVLQAPVFMGRVLALQRACDAAQRLVHSGLDGGPGDDEDHVQACGCRHQTRR